MMWQQWVLIVVFAVNTLAVIGMIGKRRVPITPSTAVVMLVINALLVWMVMSI